MSWSALVRLAGIAGIGAGVLRVATAFVSAGAASVSLEWLYLAIDVLLLFAVVGVYAYQHAEIGVAGLIGFVLTAAGVESIGGPDGKLGAVDIYPAGASLIGVGLLVLAIASWKARRLPRYVLVLWILSTLLGAGGMVPSLGDEPFRIAGVAFGLGFVGAGVRLVMHPHRAETERRAA